MCGSNFYGSGVIIWISILSSDLSLELLVSRFCTHVQRKCQPIIKTLGFQLTASHPCNENRDFRRTALLKCKTRTSRLQILFKSKGQVQGLTLTFDGHRKLIVGMKTVFFGTCPSHSLVQGVHPYSVVNFSQNYRVNIFIYV